MSASRTRVLLIRHGHHDPGGRLLQHRCAGLDPVGLDQAARLARRLSTTPVDLVLASRAARAFQTAAAVAEALGTDVPAQTCDLCEMHPGEAEGMTYEEMAEKFGPNYRSVPGAEYFPDWLPGAVRRLRALADRSVGKTLIAITHSGVIKASFQAFGNMPHASVEAIRADNTGITEWIRPTDPSDPRYAVWSLVRHNDTAHLHREINVAV